MNKINSTGRNAFKNVFYYNGKKFDNLICLEIYFCLKIGTASKYLENGRIQTWIELK